LFLEEKERKEKKKAISTGYEPLTKTHVVPITIRHNNAFNNMMERYFERWEMVGLVTSTHP
jgi:hypothetical protein